MICGLSLFGCLKKGTREMDELHIVTLSGAEDGGRVQSSKCYLK